MFPDTANFKGQDICTCDESKFNNAMDTWAKMVLKLLFPLRHIGDIMEDDHGRFPFTHKLRAIYNSDCLKKTMGMDPTVFSEENMQFLQNIQDSARNSLRYKINADDLQSGTEPFHPDECDLDSFEKTDDDNDDMEENAHYEMFLNHLDNDEE